MSAVDPFLLIGTFVFFPPLSMYFQYTHWGVSISSSGIFCLFIFLKNLFKVIVSTLILNYNTCRVKSNFKYFAFFPYNISKC